MSALDSRSLLNDPEVALQLALDGRQSITWTAIPGIVTKVDLTNNTVEVQPAIRGSIEDENGNTTFVDLPVLIHVPIVFPRAGGFILTLPIAVNDEVLVIFSSRAIDSWWQSGGVQMPVEYRMHDLSDGFAIPGPCSQPKKVANISATDAQLRSLDGTVFLAIGADGKIRMTASEVDITGNLKVSGTIVATGEVTGNAIPLSTHIHPGVTPGVGDTGAPIP